MPQQSDRHRPISCQGPVSCPEIGRESVVPAEGDLCVTPSPLTGEGWGEGEKARICKLGPVVRRRLDAGSRRDDGVMQRSLEAGTHPSYLRRGRPTVAIPLRNRRLSAASLWHLCRKPVARIRASSYEAPQNAAVSNTFGENHRPPASSAKSWSGAATTLPARTGGRPTVSHFRPFKCPFRPVRLSRPSHTRPSSSYGMSTSGHE